MSIIAQTLRFVIRQYTVDEEELFVDLFTDPRLTPYIPKRDEAQTRELFKTILAEYTAGDGFGRWGIFALDGELIGFVMLKQSADDVTKAELGYNIHYKYWNKGIATEACRVVITYGFEQQRLEQITAVIVPENVASEKVLIKAGLYKTGEIERNGLLLFSYAVDT